MSGGMIDTRSPEHHRALLAAILDSSRDAIIGKDMDGVVTSWNPGAEAIFGYSAGEILGAPFTRLIPEDERGGGLAALEAFKRGDRVDNLEARCRTKAGRRIDVSISAMPIRDPAGRVVGAWEIVRDITAFKAREQEYERLRRLYAALSQVNQAIVWATSREELFQRTCRALVEDGGFRMAWVGWTDPATRRLVPVAECGDEGKYLESTRIYVDERPEGLGPSGRAVRLGRPYISNDLLNEAAGLPWRPEAERRGLRASAAFPIEVNSQAQGALTVYADRPEVFQDKEIALLEGVAKEISFGLDNLAREEARGRAEQALRDEKLFSDRMLESMPGILYFYDSNGRFLRWNRSFEAISGYSAEEFARMHPLDFFAEADRPLLERRIAEVFEKGDSSVEAPLRAKDGTTTPYYFTGRRIAFQGRPCLVGMGIDISQRRRAEEQLAESERKYRELVEHANSIILRWSVAGTVLFLNEFGQKFFGYPDRELIGRHVVGTIVPPDESGGRNLRELVEQMGKFPDRFAQSLNENMRRNGERVWISWTNRVVRDAEGRVVELLSVGTDMTEQRRAEEARRQSEARYRKLFECAPDGIVIADRESRYLDANQSACRMLGYSREELIGMSASDIVDPSEMPEIAPALDTIAGAADHHREWRFRRKDGSTVEAEVIATMMPDGNLLGMLRDISERKQAEAEREKRHRAEAADHVKSAFLATMSHELRTPLNSIIGFTGVMLQGLTGSLNPEQHKQLTMVRSSARHLLALVNDVLDISKIEAGQFEVAREPFDPRASLAKVLALVRPQIEAKGLALDERLAPELGMLVGDQRRFEQILLNLLSNAVKFTEHGQIAVSAALGDGDGRAGQPGSGRVLRVSVSDTGIGIRPEHMASLFQPFRQIDSGLSRCHEGTGLGLAICRRLAELMGGDIAVQSEWEKGSVFTLTLPMEGPPGP